MVSQSVSNLLDQVFVGQERVTSDEIQRRAAAADLPAGVLAQLDALPEGEYAQDEVEEALDTPRQPLGDPSDTVGDFATEHDDTTTGPDLDYGPERVREEESPRSLGGMDAGR